MHVKELTIAEMRSRHSGEWVLVGDTVLDEVGRVLASKVIAHHEKRDAMFDEALRQHARALHTATLCFKELPQGTAIVF